MKVVQTFVIIGSIILCFVIQGHVFLLSTPPTSSSLATQSTTQTRLIYDAAKKAYDQAVAYVKNCENNIESITNTCKMLQNKYLRLKERYEQIYKELSHVTSYSQKELLQQHLLTANNFGKQAKESYTTCETKTLAQAQMNLQDANERKQSAYHSLEQAKELLAHATGQTTTQHNTDQPTTKPSSHSVENGSTQTSVPSHDTHGSDDYLFKPKNDGIDFDLLTK